MSDDRAKPFDYLNLRPLEAKALLCALGFVSDTLEITDTDGKLCFVNESFEITTGYSLDEALGKTPKEILRSDQHDDSLYGAIWDAVSNGKVWRGHFHSRNKDGSLFRHLATIAPVEHEGETVYLAVKQPLTVNQAERHEVQQATRDAELHAVRQRLRVANEDLIASASMALVGQLAAAVGHEINNPAQALRSCLEHLAERRETLSGHETAEVIDDALSALRRIETVTSELTPFSGGSLSGTSRRVELNSAVGRGLRVAHNELRHRSQITETYGEIPRVEGLEGRLAQLMAGLFLFVARGIDEDAESNHIHVTTRSDSDYVYAEVDCRVKAKKDFFEVVKGRLLNWEGHHPPASRQWISLILCQQIAVSHGGTLMVSDISDAGALLTLRLPRTDQEDSYDAILPRVLLIDDEKLILRSLTRSLRAEFEVETASSGKEALELIKAGQYDAVVCDLMMPGLSGVAVFERLSELKHSACERFIFISAGTFTDKTQDFADSTSQPLLRKPIRADELKNAIKQLLSKLGASSRSV